MYEFNPRASTTSFGDQWDNKSDVAPFITNMTFGAPCMVFVCGTDFTNILFGIGAPCAVFVCGPVCGGPVQRLT